MFGDEQWLRADVVSYLYDRGLIPVARDYQSRYQYNIVFVHRDLRDVDRVRWALTQFQSAGLRSAVKPEPVEPPSATEKIERWARGVAGRVRSGPAGIGHHPVRRGRP